MGVLYLQTHIFILKQVLEKAKQAFGVYLNDQAISYSFDFAVGAAEELDFTWQTGSITRANIAILIEI